MIVLKIYSYIILFDLALLCSVIVYSIVKEFLTPKK